jgi:two-component system, OmpR family, response regulator QseB
MRVLLVEDDAMIGESVRKGLQLENFTVDWVQDGAAAARALANDVYSMLLLDLGLPRKSGMELLREVRQRGNTIPTLIVTARDAVAERIDGLNQGADDYLIKPFDLSELVARVRALLRRWSGRAQSTVEAGNISLDPITHSVRIGEKQVDVSAKEFALLQALMHTPGAVLSREELEDRLYGWQEEVSSNTVEVHIHNLRKKLGQAVIRNVRGVGYKISSGD